MENFYNAIRDDGVIDENEGTNLNKLKSTIIENAYLVAEKDGNIEKEETAIINLLFRLLKYRELDKY